MLHERTFDPIWRDIYTRGHTQRYPWDAVVSFVYRHVPRDRDRGEVRILEVGCGTASNLWFASREGFSVTGVDASEVAVGAARRRFHEDGLAGDFIVADFTNLPLGSECFDLAIDRAAITNCGYEAGGRAIREVRRILKPTGTFFFNPYAAGHSSQATGNPGPDGVVVDISGGTLTGVGQICFYGDDDIRSAFANGWQLESMRHMVQVDMINDTHSTHSEWRVIARKT